MSAKQSSNKIFMVEPREFYSNPQTESSNHYQMKILSLKKKFSMKLKINLEMKLKMHLAQQTKKLEVRKYLQSERNY